MSLVLLNFKTKKTQHAAECLVLVNLSLKICYVQKNFITKKYDFNIKIKKI